VVTLNFFWAWVVAGIFAVVCFFIGRLWCAVCPFMITAEWVLRTRSLWLSLAAAAVPTQMVNRCARAWVLFGGFV